MKKAILIMILSLSALTGCGFLSKEKSDLPNITTKTVVIDRELLRECEPLARIDRTEISQEELDRLKFVWIEKYGVCANRQHKSIQTIKELANIKETPNERANSLP